MRFRYATAILLGALVFSDQEASASLATPYCSASCGPQSECFDECLVPVGEIWQFTTCGEYDGGAENDMCNPDSCDTSCSVGAPCGTLCSSGGDPTDCDTFGVCAVCGDDICAPGVENRTNCASDCGYCGDGTCDSPAELSGAGYCSADCGDISPPDSQCDPTEQDCDSGEVCNARSICEPVSVCNSTGLCTSNSQCCTNLGEKCFKFPLSNQGFCAKGAYGIGEPK